MTLRLVQFRAENGARHVGVPSDDGASLRVLAEVASTYELARIALEAGTSLDRQVHARLGGASADYAAAIAEKRVLVPLDHPDPCRCHVMGTGLTHLGSADARDRMHKTLTGTETLTDSMKMFRDGLAGGKPKPGEPGAQPEWFYKGNGRFLVAPEQPLALPAFAEDGGEEPELAGLYLIDGEGNPRRLGFALANEYSDHVTERRNYLLLAHSKLRQSSFGPEMILGDAPADIRGTSRIRRGGQVIFEKPFLTGEANMSHTIANLEHHHFKYAEFRAPGDVHVHYFGTATLSFTDGIRCEPGDAFEIEAPGFGRALRNGLGAASAAPYAAARGV